VTDKEAKTPFTVANLRLYRQTYFGIREVLAPLVMSGKAVVLPMQEMRPGVPWLLEICPASLLKRMNLYTSYKGKTPEMRENRATILAAFETMGLVIESEPLREKILDNQGGDALDSVLGAFITWQTLHDFGQLKPASALQALEGRVYF
jgi:hypothetical protein